MSIEIIEIELDKNYSKYDFIEEYLIGKIFHSTTEKFLDL